MKEPIRCGEGIPVLESERLRLRGHRPGDFEDSVTLWADERVTRYIGGKPFSREEVWARLLRYAGHWAWLGYGYWVVEEKSSGMYIGEVGYANHRRDLQPQLPDMPELGWVLATRAQGRGYATEAVRTAMNWGEVRFGNQKTFCMIDPGNLPSIRVAQKCGFRETFRTTYKNEPTVVFLR